MFSGHKSVIWFWPHDRIYANNIQTVGVTYIQVLKYLDSHLQSSTAAMAIHTAHMGLAILE